MYILGIDPGVSTGIVLYSTLFGVSYSTTISGVDPIPAIESLLIMCSYIVIETAPQLGALNQIRRLEAITNSIQNKIKDSSDGIVVIPIPKIISLSPGEWKPFSIAQKWQERKTGTQHEKDAYCMILYALQFKIKD